jgi:cell fate regulator YaaT (PSP1 superfamily)
VYGEVVDKPRLMPACKLRQPTRKVVRLVNEQDHKAIESKSKLEKEAFQYCIYRATHRRLSMKLVSVEFLDYQRKAIFYFTAEGRVDFRDLVKDLAHKFKTRIEMRQIGVRDEAKMLGGIGPCGRKLCCSTFINSFDPVTIRMAKDQDLTLNPTKISGLCGRLMCCLSFEHKCYKQIKKEMPSRGEVVMTPDGEGVVVKINLMKEKVILECQEGKRIEVASKDVVRMRQQGGKATEKAVERVTGENDG